MPATISLKEIVDAIDCQAEDSVSYLDPETGEMVVVTREDADLAEEESLDLETLPKWQQDQLPKIRAALKSDRFLPLPTSFDVHEWSIMERFSRDQRSERIRNQLLDAIHGAGAFRMFRSTIRRLGIEERWYDFRQKALQEVARDWLEQHGLPFK
jgi:hypothetical protein